MNESHALLFESHRARLRGIAYRMLGSSAEADDAVQDAWLKLRNAAEPIHNLGGWLTTAVTHISLDMLRARARRREEPLPDREEAHSGPGAIRNPEEEALLAEAVGIGLLIIMDRLAPAERVAYVLHDLFGMRFDDIGRMLDRSTEAVRQLASRARRRVQGDPVPGRRSDAHREAVLAFFAASRDGDYEVLLRLLDPDVELHIESQQPTQEPPVVIHGAATVSRRSLQGAAARGGAAEVLMIDGREGIGVAPSGQLRLVMTFVVLNSRIQRIDIRTCKTSLDSLRLEICTVCPATR